MHIFESPGIPWNLDVALLALVYITIGFYYKENINAWINVNSSKYDVIATLVTILLIVFCVFNYRNDRRFYYFDMKLLYYKELISVILIPLAFGIVLFRLVYWISKCKVLVWLNIGLSYIGKMTVPIMFMHVPLNNWGEELGYGRLVYILIGVGIPLVVTLVLNRFKIMRRIFGLQRM